MDLRKRIAGRLTNLATAGGGPTGPGTHACAGGACGTVEVALDAREYLRGMVPFCVLGFLLLVPLLRLG